MVSLPLNRGCAHHMILPAFLLSSGASLYHRKQTAQGLVLMARRLVASDETKTQTNKVSTPPCCDWIPL